VACTNHDFGNMFSSLKTKGIFLTTYARTALLLALKAIPVTGKDVLLPAFTCPVAVVGAVVEAGGNPVFVDINLKNLNFDLNDLEKKITPKSVAIVSHHYFGTVNTEVTLNHEIAKKWGLIHIQDCSHSLGAQIDGKLIGDQCDMAVYSFTKYLTCPGGGFLRCNDNGYLLQKINGIYHGSTDGKIGHMLLNMEVFAFFYQLFIIRRFFEKPSQSLKSSFLLHRVPWLWYAVSEAINRLSGDQYYHGSFFKPKKKNRQKQFSEFDLRMTSLQYFFIKLTINSLGQKIEKKRKIARRLNVISHNFIQESKGQFFVYPTFVICTRDKQKLLSSAKRVNIYLNQTWPAEGNYVEAQYSKNIDFLCKSMLLLNISEYWSERDVEIVEDFMSKNRSMIIEAP